MCLLLPGVSHDKDSKVSGADVVGQNDLVIVGPGVLGRIVAEKWQKVFLATVNILMYLSITYMENHAPKLAYQAKDYTVEINLDPEILQCQKNYQSICFRQSVKN